MRRLATTFALSGWLGFCAISSLAAAVASIAHAVPGLIDIACLPDAWLPFLSGAAGAEIDPAWLALLWIAAAGGILHALVLFHLGGSRRQRSAEISAALAGGIVAALFVLRALAGVPVAPGGDIPAVFSCIVFAALALFFDRAMEPDVDSTDEAAFEAASAAIAQGMARQVRLYGGSTTTDRNRPS